MKSDFGVVKVEWSAFVIFVCVCVTDPSLLQDYIKLGLTHTHTHARTHTHITTALHSSFATPKSDSTPLHGQVSMAAVNQIYVIHEAMSSCKNLKIG